MNLSIAKFELRDARLEAAEDDRGSIARMRFDLVINGVEIDFEVNAALPIGPALRPATIARPRRREAAAR